jgi:hypothetical protein
VVKASGASGICETAPDGQAADLSFLRSHV